MDQADFNDPRLVAIYDAEYGWAGDDDFFVEVLAEEPVTQVLDLGCGTGRLALGLASRGYDVTGVDPAKASLDAARAKPGADSVTWVEGTSKLLSEDAFDVAVMTSHVAQFIVGDEEWAATLGHLRRALRPGGRLVFDTRNPLDRVWSRWNRRDSQRQVALADGRQVETWAEASEAVHGVVQVTLHYVFSDGEELLSTADMRFRTEDEVRDSLRNNGFSVERIFGGWRREPVGQGDGELLVLARASA